VKGCLGAGAQACCCSVVITNKKNSFMLQFAVGFVIYTKLPWREIKNQKWAAGPHKSKTTQRSKCQVHKSDTSELRWEHPQDKAHKLRGGGGKNNPIKSKA